MTSTNEQTLIKKQLFFLNLEQKTEKIGEIFDSDLKCVAEKYVKDKFQSKLHFCDKKKLEVQEDKNCPNEYYLFNNNSLYRKELLELKGYLWNSSASTMKKIGKFVIIDVEVPIMQIHVQNDCHEPNQNLDTKDHEKINKQIVNFIQKIQHSNKELEINKCTNNKKLMAWQKK